MNSPVGQKWQALMLTDCYETMFKKGAIGDYAKGVIDGKMELVSFSMALGQIPLEDQDA